MKLISRTLSTLVPAAFAAGAIAAPQQFATAVQNIRCGVVVLDNSNAGTAGTDGPGRSVAPFAFYNLQNAFGIKPVGWNLYNPHAPGTVTSDIVTRWSNILGTTSTDLPILGAPVTKNNAEYWAVHLNSTSDSNLSDYDVLLVNPGPSSSTLNLSPLEQSRLTKFVDQGGILWIDTLGGYLMDPSNGWPVSFALNNFAGTSTYADSTQPVLSTPFALSGQDLNIVAGQGEFATTTGMVAAGTADLADSVDFFRFLGLTYVNNEPTIAETKLGDGEIIVTTQGPSQVLNRSTQTVPFYLNGAASPINYSYTAAPPNLETDGISAAKLAVNIISQLQSYPQNGGGARKTGGSTIDVTAPVLGNWKDESAALPAAPTPPAPVLYKGVTVASVPTAGGYQLVVYSSNPGSDLDQDGDPDDGIYQPGGAIDNTLRDWSVGKGYDIIWKSAPIPGPISSPVCAEVPDATTNGLPADQVMVVDTAGNLYVYGLFTKVNGHLIGGIQNPLYKLQPQSPGQPGLAAQYARNSATPNAPTVSGDIAYVADYTQWNPPSLTGRVWVVDLSTGYYLTHSASSAHSSTDYFLFGGGNTNGINPPAYTSSPTVADIAIKDGSGGYDKVLYGPGVVGQNTTPCFDSVWIGAKSEASPYTVTGNTLTITTRAASKAAPIFWPQPGSAWSVAQRSLAPRVTFLDSNGYGISGENPSLVDGGTGIIVATVSNAAAISGVRVDYTLDWGNDPEENSQAMERGRLILPTPTVNQANQQNRRILGPIAITSAGTLVFTDGDPSVSQTGVVGSGDYQGSLWWVRENLGRGLFQVAGRWALYQSHSIASAPTPTTSPSVFTDDDPMSAMIAGIYPPAGSPMYGYHWTGAPVIEGNQVIATASAIKSNGFLPSSTTLVMAFAAEPPTPSFQASTFPSGFSLIQPDFDKSNYAIVDKIGSATPVIPDQTSTITALNAQQVGYQYDTTSGVAQLPNLADVTNGQIGNCLSLSQPVIIRGGIGVDTVLNPASIGGTWSPLHYFCVFNGITAAGRPLVTGNTIFYAGSSMVPSMLTYNPANGPFNPSYNGMISAMLATNSPNNGFGDANSQQVWLMSGTAGASPLFNPAIKMPYGQSSSFSQYLTSVVQQILGNSTQAYGVVGGGKNLAAYGNAGNYGLSQADFAICDQGRVITADSSGNISYSSNANLNTGPGGGSIIGNVTAMNRPNRSYLLNSNEMLMVDAGGNRVVKTNNAGGEERVIDHFNVDPNYLPSGYAANEPRTLSAPSDALTYSNYVYFSGGAPQQVSVQQPVEYWVHYLVADTGNKRLVETIDRYSVDTSGRVGNIISINEPNPNATPTRGGTIPTISVPQTSVLLWQSPANVSGSTFAYNSVSRVYLYQNATSGRYVYVAGVGSTQPSLADSGLTNQSTSTYRQSSTGGGGVVIFDPASTNGIQVYNSFAMPNLSSTPFLDVSAGPNAQGNYTYDTNTIYNSLGGSATSGGATHYIAGLTSVSAVSTLNNASGSTGGALQIMLTESTGVYEFNVDPTLDASATGGSLGSPDWFINNGAYVGMRYPTGPNPSQFHAAYAKRLSSGDVLLVNSYNGNNLDHSAYTGDVLMINGSQGSATVDDGGFNLAKQNLGFDIRSIKFFFPTPVGGRGLVSPVFADRR